MSFTVAAVVENGLQYQLSFHSQVFEYKKNQQFISFVIFYYLFCYFLFFSLKCMTLVFWAKNPSIRYFRENASGMHKTFLIGYKRVLEITLHIWKQDWLWFTKAKARMVEKGADLKKLWFWHKLSNF